MRWSDDAFRARIARRASEIGKTLRQVLKEAGIAHDAIEKIPVSGRRVDTLERLAAALDWSLAQVMGYDPSPWVTPELLKMATQVTRQALRSHPHDDDTAIEITARVYNVLAARQRDGVPTTEETLQAIAAYISSEWQKG